MINNISYRVTAILLALLMFLSSTGFSIDIHYCQDQIAGMSLFGKAKSCHDTGNVASCHKSKKSCHSQDNILQSDEDGCCHNENVVIKKSDVDATSTPQATIHSIQFNLESSLIAVFSINPRSIPFNLKHSYKTYRPPLPKRDIQVLFQTFLI